MTNLDAAPRATAKQIAAALHETHDRPITQIIRIVEVLGAEQTWAFVRQAEEIEAQGGMFLESQERCRTLGELRATAGTATTCKITLVARPPARATNKPGYAFMLLQSCPPPSLPRGLPVPPRVPALP